MAAVTKNFAKWWRRRPKWTVGLDLTAHSMRILVLERSSSDSYRCVHAIQMPLPHGAINGLVLEAFDLIADTLADKVQELGLEGCAVAMALPSQGVRELNWSTRDVSTQLWHETHVYKHVQQALQLPQEAWSFDFGIEHASLNQQAWAVVARESVVQERYELAEQAGLLPKILDVDRLALDRLLNMACHEVNAWPSLWLTRREGVLSAHLAVGSEDVLSASAYAIQGESVLSQLKVLTAKALSGYDTSEWQHDPVAIRLTGVDDLRETLMSDLKTLWPQAHEAQSPCALSLDDVDSRDQYAVAYGLALHPGLA